jgi:hypothetical protein
MPQAHSQHIKTASKSQSLCKAGTVRLYTLYVVSPAGLLTKAGTGRGACQIIHTICCQSSGTSVKPGFLEIDLSLILDFHIKRFYLNFDCLKERISILKYNKVHFANPSLTILLMIF